MKKTMLAVFVLSSAAGLSSCVVDSTSPGTNYGEYTPGYTGYTVSYDAYAPYENGYGPDFWSPRYYYYTGYNNHIYGGNSHYYDYAGRGGYHR